MTRQTGGTSQWQESGDVLRVIIFVFLVEGGADLLKACDVLAKREAVLVSFVIAALILLFIPSRKRIEPRPAIFNLVALVSGYGILVKFRPWLAAFMNPLLATAISVVLMLSLAFAFLKLLRPRRQG